MVLALLTVVGAGSRVHAGGYGPSLINFNWVHIYGVA